MYGSLHVFYILSSDSMKQRRKTKMFNIMAYECSVERKNSTFNLHLCKKYTYTLQSSESRKMLIVKGMEYEVIE